MTEVICPPSRMYDRVDKLEEPIRRAWSRRHHHPVRLPPVSYDFEQGFSEGYEHAMKQKAAGIIPRGRK